MDVYSYFAGFNFTFSILSSVQWRAFFESESKFTWLNSCHNNAANIEKNLESMYRESWESPGNVDLNA